MCNWMDDVTQLLRWQHESDRVLVCNAPHGQYRITHTDYFRVTFECQNIGEYDTMRAAANAANAHFDAIMSRLHATASV